MGAQGHPPRQRRHTSAPHHPLRLAGDLLTADVLTGGRLSIGLGSGSTAVEFAAFGVGEAEQGPEAPPARFAEGLEVLEQAWAGGRSPSTGATSLSSRPSCRALRPLEVLWIAATSEAQARLAGQRGCG